MLWNLLSRLYAAGDQSRLKWHSPEGNGGIYCRRFLNVPMEDRPYKLPNPSRTETRDLRLGDV
jgi:hypothetical protein